MQVQLIGTIVNLLQLLLKFAPELIDDVNRIIAVITGGDAVSPEHQKEIDDALETSNQALADKVNEKLNAAPAAYEAPLASDSV